MDRARGLYAGIGAGAGILCGQYVMGFGTVIKRRLADYRWVFRFAILTAAMVNYWAMSQDDFAMSGGY
jgi:hypothetical protein